MLSFDNLIFKTNKKKERKERKRKKEWKGKGKEKYLNFVFLEKKIGKKDKKKSTGVISNH
jgi:hypothetical protein